MAVTGDKTPTRGASKKAEPSAGAETDKQVEVPAQAVARPLRRYGPSAADAFNAFAFAGTLGGWLCLLLGQRVLDAEEGLAKALTALGVVALVGCFAQRAWAASLAAPDRRSAARAFAALSGVGLVALAIYFAVSEWGREALAIGRPKMGEPDTFGDVAIVLWVTLLLVSLVPTVLGELARRSMLRAERFESRRVLAAVVSGVAVSLALAYGSLFTYSAGELDVSADFSFFRVAKPSEATGRMLDSLEEPLRVLVFFPAHSEVGQKVVVYLEDLRKLSDKIAVEVHDRLLDPDLANEHKVRKDGVLVLVRGQMSETLDIGDDEARAASTLKKLDGEFQKVLIKALRDKRTAYLTVGHGELNESTDRKSLRTVSMLRQLIESQNYSIKNLGLAEGLADKVPDDASVVLVLGPTEPLSEGEVEALGRYGEGGGKLLLALDPEGNADLAPLAAAVGVKWDPALVLNDKVLYRMKRNDSDKRILVAKRFSSHASVSTLSKLAARGAAVLLPGSASLAKLEGTDKDYRIDFAVKSVPGSYADVEANWTFDQDKEKKATYDLAAAVARDVAPAADAGGKPGAKAGDTLEMRAFVLGDADVFTDPVMEFANTNRLLFLEALRWLGGEESFSGEISETEDVTIVHTKSEDQVWFYTAILGVPSLILGAGMWLSRRPRKVRPRGKGETEGGTAARRRRRAGAEPVEESESEGESEEPENEEEGEEPENEEEGEEPEGEEPEGEDEPGDESDDGRQR